MLKDIFLLIILAAAVYTDLRSGKIYNQLIYPSMIIALTFNIFEKNLFPGLLFSLKGLFLGMGLLIIPYALGAMGAGDVKLLGLVGSLKGASFVFGAGLLTFIIGGLISLLILVVKRNPSQSSRSFQLFIINLVNLLTKVEPLKIDAVNNRSYKNMRYSLAIFMGTIITIFLL